MAKKRNNKKNAEEMKQTAKVIWAVFILVIVFFGSYYLFKSLGIGKIDVQGLTFVKEKQGDLTVYHYYYIYQDKTGQLVQNNIYLRNNPEKMDVPVYGDEITYPAGKFAYVSINASAMEPCSMSSLGLYQVSSFLINGGITARSAVMVKDSNLTNNTAYRTCEIDKNNPIIQINSGNETRIDINGLCYNIQFASCNDVLPAIEKFIVQSIVDAKQQTAKEISLRK